MKERLALFLKSENLSPSKFAEIMGVPPSSISHLLAGRNKPGFDFLSKMIERFPRLSPDWILLGNGYIYRQGTLSDKAFQHVTDKPVDPTVRPVRTVEPDSGHDLFATSSVKPQSSQSKAQEPNKKIEPKQDIISIMSDNSDQNIDSIVILFSDRTFTTYKPK